METNKYNLEDRFIKFAVDVSDVVELLPETKLCNHLGSQLIRSCTSPALNYGEAQSAESKKDFTHKMSIIAKEVRESRNSLKILSIKQALKNKVLIDSVLDEAEQLCRIMKKSLQTAEANMKMDKLKSDKQNN